MRHRSLSLKRETLTELTGAELAGVAGGSHLCPVTDACLHPSFDEPCPTLPVFTCIAIESLHCPTV